MRMIDPGRLLLLSLLVGAAGCPPPPERPKNFDPDEKSGPDAARANAQPLPLDVPITDFVSYRKRDRTDWKVIEVPAPRGTLSVKLRWDDTQSELMLAVFDGLGVEVIQGTRTDGQRKTVEWSVDAEQPRYYVRVTAPLDGYESSYSLLAKWTDSQAGAVTTPVQPVQTPPQTTAETPVEQPVEPSTPGDVTDWLQGRIVTSYREGSFLMLHLDKGSAAGVKVGTRGVILQGPSGAIPLEGSEFTVERVVDGTKCIAKSRAGAAGKNLRVAINVAP